MVECNKLTLISFRAEAKKKSSEVSAVYILVIRRRYLSQAWVLRRGPKGGVPPSPLDLEFGLTPLRIFLQLHRLRHFLGG